MLRAGLGFRLEGFFCEYSALARTNFTTALAAKATLMRGEPMDNEMQLQNPGTTLASPRLAVTLELVRRMHSDEPQIMSSCVALYASSSEHLLSAPGGTDPQPSNFHDHPKTLDLGLSLR